MANAKMATRQDETVTTTVMVGAGAPAPKGAKQFTFTPPQGALKMFRGKPGKMRPLLQRYGEAVVKSQEAGHPVSFRVEVDPDGDATVTSIDAGATGKAFPIETVAERDPALIRELEAARERGRLRAADVLAGDDMFSADGFADLLGTSRVTINSKRRAGQVLGLEGATRGFRFPAWQVDADGRPYGELPALHESLGGPWAVYRFLVQKQGALDGLTGRQALERGKGAEAIAAAEGIARGDFT